VDQPGRVILTNSDFELAGVVMHQDVLAQRFDIAREQWPYSNDMVATHRSKKGVDHRKKRVATRYV
jgi:hypothetical protein